jgi:hypothetical protein
MEAGMVPGARLGAYVIERELGRGGMGTVYLANDPALDRPVALKLLEPSLGRDERFVRRFLLESKASARLDHPAIVQVYAAGEEQGRLYIAMRYVPGGTLQQRLADHGALDPAAVLRLLGPIADALDAAHDGGLVHRDVKPGNILLDGQRSYLCDFGLARVASSIDSLSREQGLSGTLAYIAPEQIEGDAVDGRADQYALACVVVQALTGAVPFERDSEVAQIYAHLSDPPPSVRARRPELPASVDAVLARALAKRPAERYDRCADLIAALAAALAGERPASSTSGRFRRRRTVVVAVGVLAVVGAAVVALTSGGGGHRPLKVATAEAATLTRPSSLTWYDPVTFHKERSIQLPQPAGIVVFDQKFLYASDLDSGATVTRIDRVTGETRTLALPGPTSVSLATTDSSLVWGSGLGPEVALIDPATGAVTRRVTLPTKGLGFYQGDGHTGIGSLAVDGDVIFVAYGQPGVVARIDRRTLRVEKLFTQPWDDGAHCCDVLAVVDGSSLWVIDRLWDGFERLDKETGQVLAKGRLGGGFVEWAAVAGGYLWLPVENDRGAWKVDHTGHVVGLVPTGGLPWDIHPGAGAVWVTNSNDETITRIDAVTGQTRQLKVGNNPGTAVIDPDGRLVVASGRPVPDPLTGLDPRRVPRILVTGDPTVPDPGNAFGTGGTIGWAVQKAVGLGLTRVADDPAPHVVPDGAASYSASPDGRVFTFVIRPGLRFSPPSGKPITAETFRASIERTMAAGFGTDTADSAFNYLREVEGAEAFHDGKADHVSGLTASGDRLTIRLTTPDGALPTILSQIMYQAVPEGTAVVPNGLSAWLPSGGPYYVARYAFDRHLLLRPNPNYHGDRRAPLAGILLDMAWSPGLATAAVIAGRADAVGTPGDDLGVGGTVGTTYGKPAPGKPVWLAGTGAGLNFLQFNTRRAVFRDAAVRRAVSAALDRVAWATVAQQLPFDSLLIPGSPGYHPHPIAGPDPSAIRRLLRGRHPQIVLFHDAVAPSDRVAEVVRQLDGMGFRTAEKGVGSPELNARQTADRPGAPWDVRLEHWLLDYPDVGATVNDLVLPEEQTFRWDMPRAFRNDAWNALIREASALTGPARDARYEELATRLLAEQAPVAVLGSWPNPIFVSQRLGCIVPTRDWIDLEQLCLR